MYQQWSWSECGKHSRLYQRIQLRALSASSTGTTQSVKLEHVATASAVGHLDLAHCPPSRFGLFEVGKGLEGSAW